MTSDHALVWLDGYPFLAQLVAERGSPANRLDRRAARFVYEQNIERVHRATLTPDEARLVSELLCPPET